jgi:hypothetical protein
MLAHMTKETLMSNLNENQFASAIDIAAQEERRKMRRGLNGVYVGIGSNFMNYPYMTGAMGTGGSYQMDNELHEPNAQDEHSEDAGSMGGETAPTTTGMGDGGTAASATGAAGGSPA